MANDLIQKTEITVRFSEVDSLGIVWHGHFIKYFEDGREDFGNHYDLGYMNIYNKGYMTPIVDIHCDYKKHIVYGEKIIVKTKYIDTPAAKIKFNYKIYRASNNELIATGYSTQVFMNMDRELILTIPPFFS